MSVTIKINTCKECPHVGHSGAFTPGGAKTTCDAPDVVTSVGCYNLSKGIELREVYHWKHRVIRNRIPIWCPLRKVVYDEQITRRVKVIMKEQ